MREPTTARMAQAFYPTNDGHVGNIQKLSRPQLLEMIQRQEKLLKKKAFLNTLADKGAKITQHLQVLKNELDRRNQESLKLDAESVRANRPDASSRLAVDSEKDANESNPTGKHSEKTMNLGDMCRNSAGGVDADQLAAALEAKFEKMQVNDGSLETGSLTKHQYEIAEERAQQNLKVLKQHPRLNRSINLTSIEEVLAHQKLKKDEPNASQHRKGSKKKIIDEESAVVPPQYKCEEAKVIPLEESLQLQTLQKHKQEELQAQLAAEKLADRLNIKLEAYNPEGVDMSYRDRKTLEDDIDSDDDADYVETAGATGMQDLLGSDTED